MQGLQVQLILPFEFDEPHGWACRRFGDGLSIPITDPAFNQQNDQSRWPELRKKLEVLFATKSLDEWLDILDGSDACVAPVRGIDESRQDPHLLARNAFVEIEGVPQPAPAPRFSATPSQPHGQSWSTVQDVLERWRRQ